ncbi:MAG: hypothetical protein LQ344_000248 [Seirophora lacunosa]|nr:MAG: hypothetical protein LQ344_000248 [Seirophora lacunosa]
MSGSFEKSVKGGTKIKLAAPKAKYVEHILVATHAGEAGVAEIFRALQNRLRDSTWTIVFKALIIVHLMIREGEPKVTLKYLADSPSKLAISNFSDVQAQGTNIRHYYSYVLSRAKAFRDTKVDWVREGQGRLKKQTVDKGLLRETESVQTQINALLKCDLLSTEPENEITLTAFRLLTMDLLILFGIMNEGTINVLEHYFEMSKYDAERAFKIYKNFSKQTDLVVRFLSVARQYENSTRLEIPKLKHAPTSLTSSLEEYLNDPDFEINRRQYLAQQEAKKSGKPIAATSSKSALEPGNNSANKDLPAFKSSTAQSANPPQPKGPAPDLIDFFDSIEQNQHPMATQPQEVSTVQTGQQFFQQPPTAAFPPATQTSFGPNGQSQQQMNTFNAPSNPYGTMPNQAQQPVQKNFTQNGYAGFPQQSSGQQQDHFSSIPQLHSPEPFPSQQQPFSTGQQQSLSTGQQSFNAGQQLPQSTNPFRQVSMPTGASNSSFASSPAVSSPLNRQGTNPFARNNLTGPASSSSSSSPFPSAQSPQQQFLPQQTAQPFQQQQQQPPQQPIQSHRTGTNPFARNASPPASQGSSSAPPQPMLLPHVTGSTNPFRQSTFGNQHTGQGWQSGQGSMGGLEQLQTVPVFPRPGQPQQQQQQPWP